MCDLNMDNCGPHGEDMLDSRGQVQIIRLPGSCTSMFQRMDTGFIASLKIRYRSMLLNKMLQQVEFRLELRGFKRPAGLKGLEEGIPICWTWRSCGKRYGII